MSALAYLVCTTVKNSFVNLWRNKGRFFLTLFLVLLMVAVVVLGHSAPDPEEDLRPWSELSALVLALYLGTFVLTVWSGLGSGGSFYRMADVNFLFPAPVQPRRVLLYGLLRQAGTSLMIGMFLVFQYGWLGQVYGVTLGQLALMLVGYGVVFFLANLTAVLLYAVSSGRVRLQRVLKGILLGGLGLLAVWLLLPLTAAPEDVLGAITGQAARLPALLFPAAGWAAGAVMGFAQGQLLSGGAWLLVLLLGTAALLAALLRRSDSGFYEDVLAATERTHTALAAAQSGHMAEAAPAKVRVGRTGLSGPPGALVFFQKHLLEGRRSRLFLLDVMSLVTIGVTLFFSMILSVDEGEELARTMSLFFMSIYLMLFTTGTGRWAKELIQPYVYLAPVSPVRKLAAICGEWVLKLAVESALLFLLAAVLLGLPAELAVVCALARIGYGLLYLGGNLLCERLLGGLVNKMLIAILYFLILLVLSVPSIVLGVLASMALGWTDPTAAILLCTLAVNGLLAAVLLFACRGLLDAAEMK